MEHTAKTPGDLQFHKVCRICGAENSHLMPIYHAEGKEHDIASKINLHLPMTSISESDELPLQVCHECASTVIIFHQLYENCAETNKHFREILQQVSMNAYNTSNDKYTLTRISATLSKGENNFELNEDDFSVWEIYVDEHSVDQPLNRFEASVEDKTRNYSLASCDENSEPPRKKHLHLEEDGSIIVKYDDDDDSITVKYEDDDNSMIKNNERTITKPTGYAKRDLLRGRACYVCGMVFRDKRDTIRHANAKHCNLDLYPCLICGDKICFLQAGDLQEHLLRRHVPGMTDTYEICDEKSEPQAVALFGKVSIVQCDSVGFEDENFVNLLNKNFFCRYCRFAFGNEYLLKRHDRWHHEGDSLNYDCHSCGNVYRDKNALMVHIEKRHTKKRCDICLTIFPDGASIEELQRHRKTHSQRSKRWPILTKYSCFVCGQAFDEIALCVSHANDHDSEEIFLNCSICYRIFKKIGQLQNHMLQVHSPDFAEINVINKRDNKFIRPSREKRPSQLLTKFTCFLCGDSFDDNKDCEIHAQNAHADAAVLKCPVCDNVYARADLLQRHLLSVHIPNIVTSPSNDVNSNKCNKDAASLPIKSKNRSELEIVCKVCSRSFENERKRNIHLKMHGPVGKNWPILTKYTCFVCGLAFENSGLCQMHVGSSHSTEVTLNCQICDATFIKLEYLQSHLFNIHSPQILTHSIYNNDYNSKNRSPVAKKRRISKCDDFQTNSRNNSRKRNDKQLYECTICRMEFMELSSIKDHVADFHLSEEIKKKCAFCDRWIENDKLAQHWLEEHAEITTRRCEICSQDFPNTQIFTQHCFEAHVQNSFKIIHSDDKLEIKFELGMDQVVCNDTVCSSDVTCEEVFNLFICPFCEAVTTNQEEYSLHANEKHPEKLSFCCDYCSLKFDTFESKETHITTKHSNSAQVFENHCRAKQKTCQNFTLKNFPNFNDCEETLFEGVNTRRDCVCLICNHSFSNKVGLERHVKKKHETNWPVLVKYTCFACGKAFHFKMDCFKHARNAHIDDVSLICPVCHDTFLKADKLQKHLFDSHTPTVFQRQNEIELQDSPKENNIAFSYKCGVCGIPLSSKYSLNRHMNAKHSELSQFEFVCLFCNKSYVAKSSLKRHINDCHPDLDE